jgi:hypothetical protein
MRADSGGCPHGRSSWASCPHCLGVNTAPPLAETPRPRCVLCGRRGYLHGPEFNPSTGQGLLVDGATGLRCASVPSCTVRVGSNRREAGPLNTARDEFLAASIAVWREIDRLDAGPYGYHPVHMSVELRMAERAAWERYRDLLDAEGAS